MKKRLTGCSMCRLLTILALMFGLAVPVQAASSGMAERPVEYAAERSLLLSATARLFDTMEAESAMLPPRRRPFGWQTLRRQGTPTRSSLGLSDAGRMALGEEFGPVKDLTGYRITWYPTDRLSGTVDFVGTWASGRNLLCGYVTWDLSEPQQARLVEIDIAYLDTWELLGSHSDRAHAALLEANCAYGELAPNFSLSKSR